MHRPPTCARDRNRSPRTALILATTALATIGCADVPSSPIPPLAPATRMHAASAGDLAAAERSAALQGRELRGIEDDILRLEAYVPGLGGLYVDTAGALVVYGPADRSAADVRVALARHASVTHLREPLRTHLASGRNVRVLPARFAFSSLVAWQQGISAQIRPGDGIVSIDADEANNRVTVGVSDASSAQQVATVAAAAGVPPEAVGIRVEPLPTFSGTLQDAYRPTVGGIQIWTAGSLGGTCTLGFNSTTSTGVTGFITASHCAPYALGAGGTGATVYQNSSSFPVGTVQNNPVWNISDPGCGTYTRCTFADVMMVRYASGITNQKWLMHTQSASTTNTPGSLTVTGTWQVNGTDFYPATGDVVDKMGRTTGWTRGTIGATCQNIVATGPSGTGVVLCANRVDGASVGEGDSGAPVFNQQFGLTYAYGILFASKGTAYSGLACIAGCSYYFSGFQAIQRMLGVTPRVY